MKTKWMLAGLMAATLGLTGCGKSESESTMPAHDTTANAAVPTNTAPNAPAANTNQVAVQYTCPMHPEVVQDTPGNCPKCGMKLVKKK